MATTPAHLGCREFPRRARPRVPQPEDGGEKGEAAAEAVPVAHASGRAQRAERHQRREQAEVAARRRARRGPRRRRRAFEEEHVGREDERGLGPRRRRRRGEAKERLATGLWTSKEKLRGEKKKKARELKVEWRRGRESLHLRAVEEGPNELRLLRRPACRERRHRDARQTPQQAVKRLRRRGLGAPTAKASKDKKESSMSTSMKTKYYRNPPTPTARVATPGLL